MQTSMYKTHHQVTMLFQVLEERRLGAGAGARHLSKGWEWKWEGALCLAEPRPLHPAPLLSLLPSVCLALGALLCSQCFGRSPSRSPSPPAQHGRTKGGGLISHTRSVNPNLFGVPYSAPLSPPGYPPQSGHFTPLLSPHPTVYSVDGGLNCPLEVLAAL